MPSPFLVDSMPVVYARFILGIDDFRAIDIVRLRPDFQAEAAILMGVFGVGGVELGSCSAGNVISFASFAGKGSELRKACLVDVTRFEKLAATLEDLRGGKGKVVRSGVESFGNVPKPLGALEKDNVDDIDRRRRAESFNGEPFRGFRGGKALTSASRARDWRFREEGSIMIRTSCGFPTEVNETNRAVSSCDFRLEPLDDGALMPSVSSIGEKSTKDSESEYSSEREASSSLERYSS